MKNVTIEYEHLFEDAFVQRRVDEICASKAKSGRMKGLNGRVRTIDEVRHDSIRGFALEEAVFRFLTQEGAKHGYEVKQSPVLEYDLLVVKDGVEYPVDVKGVRFDSIKGSSLTVSQFEYDCAPCETLYLVFDVSEGVGEFRGWFENFDLKPSKFNGSGYVFLTELRKASELPF